MHPEGPAKPGFEVISPVRLSSGQRASSRPSLSDLRHWDSVPGLGRRRSVPSRLSSLPNEVPPRGESLQTVVPRPTMANVPPRGEFLGDACSPIVYMTPVGVGHLVPFCPGRGSCTRSVFPGPDLTGAGRHSTIEPPCSGPSCWGHALFSPNITLTMVIVLFPISPSGSCAR